MLNNHSTITYMNSQYSYFDSIIGCVIGITTAIYSSSGTNSGVGFAIPADTVGPGLDSCANLESG